jgi:hypothetical protein
MTPEITPVESLPKRVRAARADKHLPTLQSFIDSGHNLAQIGGTFDKATKASSYAQALRKSAKANGLEGQVTITARGNEVFAEKINVVVAEPASAE